MAITKRITARESNFSKPIPKGEPGARFEFGGLVSKYERAILAGDLALIDQLAGKVEAEADRLGYTNHARLAHLHTLAETVGNRLIDRNAT